MPNDTIFTWINNLKDNKSLEIKETIQRIADLNTNLLIYGEEKDIDARFIFSADDDIEQRVRQGTFREDLYYRISPYRIWVPPLRERKKDILPLVTFFANREKLEISIDKKALNTLNDYSWRGNIREIENFITTASVGKTELTNDDIYGLLKRSEDFFDTFKGREMSMEQLEMRYIDYLMRKYKNKAKVAKILRISRKSLYNKLNKKGKETGV